MKKKRTLQDIADLCNTSKSTVSRVITQRGYVAADTRDLILETIEKEGYRPQKSHKENHVKDMVMVVSCQLNSDAQMTLAEAIRKTLEEKGIKTAVISVDFGSDNVYDYLDYARERDFGGVITLGVLDTPEFRSAIKKLRCPTVLLNQKVEGVNSGIVQLNDYQGAYEATKYLLRRGHKKIVFLSGYKNAVAIQDRENGFVQCMRDHGYLAKDIHVVYKSFEEESGRRFAHEMVNKDYPYTAIMCASESLSLGVYTGFNELGVKIPKDVSVLGFGFSKALSLCNPMLTIMDYDFEAVGKALAIMMAKHIERPFMQGKIEYFDANLLEGNSVVDLNEKEL